MERSNKTLIPQQASGRRKAPTMEDVARRAGVSRSLVSLVMRDAPNVSDARRKAVHEAAAALGYRPNAAARRLAEHRSATVGVVLNDLHNPFFADVVDGIQDAADKYGYRLLLNTARRADGDELKAVESFLEHRVEAVIVLGPRADVAEMVAASASAALVAVGSDRDGIDSVVNDDQRGSALVVEHLTGLGHRRIVHLDGGPGGGAERRRQGYEQAMAAAGLEPWVIPGDFTEAAGAAAVERIETAVSKGRDWPTAIYAANDLAALGALDRLTSAGLRVPGDVSLVGYDNTSVAGLRLIGLTTVNQPRAAMGTRALELAIERLDGRRHHEVTHTLEPTLIVRATTAAITMTP